MQIHPTAVIDPEAEIGPDVQIGPYCIIGPKVKLGARCRLQGHVVIQGPTIIGEGNRFFAFTSIGQQTQDLKYEAEPTYLEIGDHNTFREFVTVHRATPTGAKTRIGSYCNFLSYSHVAHDCVIGDYVIFSNNGSLAGHVHVGDRAYVGAFSGVHQFCRIGTLSITGGFSKIVQDVPPYVIADGNPAIVRGLNVVGLERAGVSQENTRVLKEAFRILYRSQLNTQQALEKLTEQFDLNAVPEVKTLIEFIQSSERGILKKVE